MDNLPEKFVPLWNKCAPLLEKSRSGDLGHAQETIKLVMEYDGDIDIDRDVLIPVAMMHDIGHFAILPEHFKHITGPNKIANGKLVHMLAGAKIANDILSDVGYDEKKKEEIVEIISMHDFDQLKNVDYKKVYNTTNKKFFHDIDSLDRYTQKRLVGFLEMYPDKNKLIKILQKFLDLFFYDEFRKIAEERFEKINFD